MCRTLSWQDAGRLFSIRYFFESLECVELCRRKMAVYDKFGEEELKWGVNINTICCSNGGFSGSHLLGMILWMNPFTLIPFLDYVNHKVPSNCKIHFERPHIPIIKNSATNPKLHRKNCRMALQNMWQSKSPIHCGHTIPSKRRWIFIWCPAWPMGIERKIE